jgi:NAD(P)-dependent dehydrogenase (short-subunit alcohol dehydrogenase family)
MRKTIFITGAAGGFGRATAARFAAAGYFLGLFDVDVEGLDELKAIYGSNCYTQRLDVSDAEDCRKVVAAFGERTQGRMDILLNNAGIMRVGDFEDVPLAEQHRLIDINLKGTMNPTYFAYSLLKATPGARVINLGSASALHGNPELVAYSLSKRAINSFTESLDIAWEKDDIHVCDINPMYARTRLTTDVQNQLRRLPDSGIKLTADDVAGAIFRATSSKQVHHYVGKDTRVFAALGGVVPFRVRRFLLRKVIGY